MVCKSTITIKDPEKKKKKKKKKKKRLADAISSGKRTIVNIMMEMAHGSSHNIMR